MSKDLGIENIIWDLSSIYQDPDSPEILDDLESAGKLAVEFSDKYRGRVMDESVVNAKLLFEAFRQMDIITELITIPNAFVYLNFSTDTASIKTQKLMMKLKEKSAEISNLLIFFPLEINRISDEKIDQMLNNEILADYIYQVEKIRKMKDHELSEAEEKIINIKSITGNSAFVKLFDELTSDFKFKIMIDGEEKIFNESQMRDLAYHKDEKIRAESVGIIFRKYEKNSLVITNIYNNIIKDLTIENQLRHFPSNISAKNLENDLKDETISTLIDITTKNNSLVQRYYRKKAKLMGVDKIKMSDTKVSVIESERTYDWNEAKELVLSTFRDFDEKFYEIADAFFTENRIHAKTSPAKMGGAFCSSFSPNRKPFVFLNFLGKQNDVMTLAHELGHGIHGVLSSKQVFSNYWPILPLAEVASVFAEILITDKLLKTMNSREEKIGLICSKLEEIFGTSHRQNMFTRFERAAHEAIGKELQSKEQLCEIYNRELESMFGDSVIYQDSYKWAWSSIPHIFHTPFYCYSYNFAQLFVIGLYQKFLEDGKNFKKQYFQLLESGGNNSAEKLAKIMDIDINDPAFWQKGFDYIEQQLLNTLENLVD